MLRSLARLALAASLLATFAASAARAQTLQARLLDGHSSLAQQPNGATESRRRVFAINPLGIPFEVVSVEVEAALHDAFTLAGNFSYFSPDEFTRSSFEVKARLYPNEQAPRAFSVGFGLGVVNTRENVSLVGSNVKQDKTHPSIGVYVDYNWLLGKSDRFFVGTGVGAKRILGDSDEFDEAPFVYSTARFLIGVAF
ncbi:MAG TPA: hypothetical protein VM076_16795 [Gemmatimonadaceae bacterium]|nr:hypothetical protein [Gemmatimonadaceae bacterium]